MHLQDLSDPALLELVADNEGYFVGCGASFQAVVESPIQNPVKLQDETHHASSDVRIIELLCHLNGILEKLTHAPYEG